MLQRLVIQNVALIGQAELEFSDGLNVLSGETGAGKSVILDAIDFVLGAKADRSLIRSGEQFCSVRAEFLSADPRIAGLLEEFDIEAEETLVGGRQELLPAERLCGDCRHGPAADFDPGGRSRTERALFPAQREQSTASFGRCGR